MSSRPPGPWYREGLAFECTRCGACCTGEPGFVWVDDRQIARLADHLGLDVGAFAEGYVRRVGPGRSLVERPNGDCVFWEAGTGCTVYPARPDQCRTWPFWPENIETPEDWARTCSTCPGAGEGTFFSREEVEAAARRTWS